ncbi:hypothetical protein [Sphingopyxis kveilinensis]|uniref:hypothetical protein n=1 Tax=Sphingopyxis kveilinensis TaxID=3114367 RepID=UPI0030CB97B1
MTKLFLPSLLAVATLAGCAAGPTKAPPGERDLAALDVRRTAATSDALDKIAASYLRLSLEIGTHEPGYIDAYYGPPELKAAAEASPRDKTALLAATRALMAETQRTARRLADPLAKRRATFLSAQLRAAETRLLMMEGTRFAFVDEAERLFGVRPRLKPLASYDAELVKIEALVPGDGALADRVEAYLDAFTIPKDRLQPTFEAAIARCRGRSAAHIPMPADESFRLEFVTGKSWSGYNYYEGRYHSLIQVNTDLPIRLSRALDLGCHEGYPGHHLLNMKLEEKLVKERGWAEFSVYPLYSPQSLIAEGSANYGIDLSFPGEAKAATERDILMPIAGIAVPADDRYWRLLAAIKRASGARLTIAQQYLDGEIDRPTAVALTQKYLLVSQPRAEQSVRFTDQYRSYVINYGLGEAMVRAHVERGRPSRDEMWRRMERIISEPTLPSDL